MEILALEGFYAGEQLIEQHADRENIGAYIDLFSTPLFRRHIVRRAEYFTAQGHIGILNFRDAEIHHLDG